MNENEFLKRNLEETIKDYWRAYNNHDLETVLAFMDENVTIYFPTDPQPIQGKEKIRKVWSVSFGKVIPDIKEEVLKTVVQGDMVACQFIESGTLTIPPEIASSVNIPVVNRPYKMRMASFFRFNAKGLIEEIHSYWDTGDFSKQIGIDISVIRSMQSHAHKS